MPFFQVHHLHFDQSQLYQRFHLDHHHKKKSQNFSDNDRSYFIQIGIFSDEINASRLLGKIKSMGYEARLEMIKMSGKEKLRLSTTVFNSKIEAQTALTILRGENLPGMIKRE